MATTPYPFVAATVLTASKLNSTFNIPTTTKTASHTLVAADAGTRILINSASATILTLNTSIFAASDVVEIQNIGAGVCTITAGSCSVSTTGTLALVQNAGGRLVFTAASTSIFQADGVATGTKIGQVVSTNLPTTFSTAATAYTDITGLSVSITPTLATSKVLVMVSFSASVSGDIAIMFRQMRDSTAINIGDAASSRTRASAAMITDDNTAQTGTFGWQFLDSPATTSATTYKVQMFVNAGTGFINRTGSDSDVATRSRTAANITVMEVIV